MKIRQLLLYIFVFLASFILTPIVFTSIIKKANENAYKYIENFNPVTSELPDGTYVGKYKLFSVFTLSKIKFDIKNGKISQFELKRLFHSPGSAYKEEIENQIKKTGKLEVNAISGATRTSNFAKAAIKDAIRNKESNF